MKISNLVEQIFATAVALDQNGGLRNTIYAIKHDVLIMNYDHTVLLRFKLRQTETAFEHPISFKANDYDSDVFEEVDGKIIFTTEKPGFTRKKICGTTDMTPEQVQELFSGYFDIGEREGVELTKDVLELLDPALSHVEFIGEEGKPIKMIQRNIYSGGIIEVTQKGTGMFSNELKAGFGPIAIKTGDLQALFSFPDMGDLKFYFPVNGEGDFILIKNALKESKRNMTGVIACCLYDEIIQIKEAKDNGRQEQKIRRRKP